jgi:uncharacterized protein with GYD domain
MPLYLTLVSYEPEALAELTQNPEDRSAAVREAAEARGAKLVAFYHSIGEYHAAVITEEPDERAALAGAWTSEAVGHLKTFKSIPLFTVEETMEALRSAAGDVALRGPERWQPEW